MCYNVAAATQPLTLLTLNITHLVLALSPGRSRLSSCVLAFKTVVEHVLNNENKLPLWVWPPPIWTLELGLFTRLRLGFPLTLMSYCLSTTARSCRVTFASPSTQRPLLVNSLS